MNFLSDTGGDLIAFPWDKLTLTVALAIAIVVIWKLNGKLAKRNDELHGELVQFHEKRAGEAANIAASYEKVVNANTEAIRSHNEHMKSHNMLLERLLDGLERQNR